MSGYLVPLKFKLNHQKLKLLSICKTNVKMITNVKLRHTTDVYAVPVTINLMIYNNAKISEALR